MPRPQGSAVIDGRPRRYTRRARRVQVHGELDGAAFARFKIALADVSLLGVCLEHTHQMLPGQIYLLDLALGDRPLRLKARAIWSRIHTAVKTEHGKRIVYRTGLEFTDPSPAATAALQDLMARRVTPRPADDTA